MNARRFDSETFGPGMLRTRWWHRTDDGRAQCDVCPRACRLRDGQRGLCFVRAAEAGEVILTTYGRSSGFCVDPIEKKPLYHFLPGTSVLSLGTAGCNLRCRFCQNWDISKSKDFDILSGAAEPEDLATAAQRLGCPSVAFTYNDPTVFLEYASDAAHACREAGIRSVAVTAGWIEPGPRAELFGAMDAANVDLKGFTEDFYHKVCGASLAAVLETLHWLVHESDVWVELTTLLIPGRNDSDAELDGMTRWVVDELGPDVPMHFTAFHPDYKMLDVAATPQSTLTRARSIARANGVRYAYTGNTHDPTGESTLCPTCGAALIQRDWYRIDSYEIEGADVDPLRVSPGTPMTGRCHRCGTVIPGLFPSHAGTWGRRRLPVSLR